VISFPVKEKHFIKGKDDVSIWEQFSNAAAMQRHWADNQVSVTVTFRTSPGIRVQDDLGNEEWHQVGRVTPGFAPVLDERESPEVRPSERDQIAACLEVYETQLKGISLLPLSDHGYVQAPYIKITKTEYENLMAKITHLDLSDSVHEVTEKFCTSDSCMI
jgi:hypothetical protein